MERRRDGRYELATPLSVWRESHGGLSPVGGTPSLDHRRALLPARLRQTLADHPNVEEEHGPKEVHLRSFVDTIHDLLSHPPALDEAKVRREPETSIPDVEEEQDLLRKLFDVESDDYRHIDDQEGSSGALSKPRPASLPAVSAARERSDRAVKPSRISARSDLLRAGQRSKRVGGGQLYGVAGRGIGGIGGFGAGGDGSPLY
ncbi:hypothetical protein M427DRAFT_341813 [Gonapodya prolifera JEL478]|uniref:Uncharacterized protein n=1 Tax=Gonapodya prolifera (strain JEL478) TaxID=1344416 RepID=A0A139ACA8_GONPJ|nr:hypothetical protein M427DRAFT_341813 [Gonapodya prolifera JEL478]|eukprot:KXS14442.1 hypothetical protein M427DRAFT_341813 [Gonapodya prolifera JEL478]